MGSNIQDLANSIKRLSAETVASGKPMEVSLGLVVGTSPLKIQLGDNFTISEGALILVESLTDYEVEVESNYSTEVSATHSHKVAGIKNIKVKRGLKVGEKVLIFRMQGGKRYVVLDRVC